MDSTRRTATRAYARSWQPATRIERELRAALRARSRDAYLRVIAGCDLFLYVPREQADGGDSVRWSTCRDLSGTWCVAVRTAGERLPRRAHKVAQRTSLRAMAELWPDAHFALCVNPGTPTEATFPAHGRHRRRWLKAAKDAAGPSRTAPRGAVRGARQVSLLTRYDGPRTGLLAQALACGAPLAVQGGLVWNDIGDVYDDYALDGQLLRESWDTTTYREWRARMDVLLDTHTGQHEPEFALEVRARLADGAGGHAVPADAWRAACARALAELGAPDRLGAAVQTLVGRIVRYEARFRADGLLPPDGYVHSVAAHDYGRAVNLARWGLSARLCGGPEARDAILRAGALAGTRHTSWADYSAGYALGRVLRFGHEEFGEWYETVLAPHRLLMTDPESPWLTLPWE
ncbi:DUF1266 domain-containing protein [Streptomyces montanisoli]|uniref:DUF1266 domain-containing protein n=1 Tax=Streptomyces montanisoli TaxID=2798581 RepID=A0A940MFI3_9ACTN|nr:DUF1266 domain-containing protein [Streptomyces montanisoli]MBP0462015.1 DUF1266 domain-containing protein [Streptomyces montanisoli]